MSWLAVMYVGHFGWRVDRVSTYVSTTLRTKMRIFEIPISKILIFNWDDSLNGKSDRCPNAILPESKQTMDKATCRSLNGCRYRA